MQAIVDGYVHCGVSKYEPIEKVVAAHDRCGIVRGVLVQHVGELDNTYIVEAAERHWPRYRAVIMGDTGELAAWAEHRAVRGLRVLVDADRAWEPEIEAAARFGLIVLASFRRGTDGLEARLRAIVQAHPETEFMLAHLASGSRVPFPAARVVAFADLPNVTVLASGFAMWPDTPEEEVTATLGELVAGYSATRVLWGSNWPVSPIESAVSYITRNPAGLADADQERLLRETSDAIWGFN
jgi:predicted TIM-barrel fold metal-dependent hydrolase